MTMPNPYYGTKPEPIQKGQVWVFNQPPYFDVVVESTYLARKSLEPNEPTFDAVEVVALFNSYRFSLPEDEFRRSYNRVVTAGRCSQTTTP